MFGEAPIFLHLKPLGKKWGKVNYFKVVNQLLKFIVHLIGEIAIHTIYHFSISVANVFSYQFFLNSIFYHRRNEDVAEDVSCNCLARNIDSL